MVDGHKKNVINSELSFNDLLTFFISQKLNFFRILISSIISGIVLALLSPIEFTSVVSVVQAGSGGKNTKGGITALAGLAGIDLGGSSESSLNPLLYNKVVNSIPFQQKLINSKYDFIGFDEPVSYQRFFDESKRPIGEILLKYTIGLPSLILGSFSKNDDISSRLSDDSTWALNEIEMKRINKLRQNVGISVDTKSGLISISATLPERVAASQMADMILNNLQEFVIRTKLSQINQKVKYLEERYLETKASFEETQILLAEFKDSNVSLSSARAETEEQRLRDEYDLAYSLYQEIAKQLETTKIELKDSTPIFSVIDPATVPTDKSSPRRAMIVFVWLFLGIILGILFIYLKLIWLRLKAQMNVSNL